MVETSDRVDEQAAFFSAVFGDEAGYVFVSVLDHVKKAAGLPGFWTDRAFAYPAQKKDILAFIAEEDSRGCDVYFAVQLYGKPDARQKTLVRACPSAWSDLDTATPWDIDPQPSVILETSPGRFHGFWRAPMTMSPYEAEDISRRIAYAQHERGADLGGWDLTQVLRIPGTRNHKYPDLPTVRLLKCDPTPIPMNAFERFPSVLEEEDPWEAPEDLPTGVEPPVLLRGWDLEHWQQTSSADKSAWAQRMVSILKEAGLADRLVEAALVDHPIYVAKAAEKWGGKRSGIIADIRRCIRYWKKHPPTKMFEGAQNGKISHIGENHQNGTDHAAGFALQSLSELVNIADDSTDQLVESILWAHRIHWAFAAPGAGKTLLLLTLGMHIAAGRPFCGRAVSPGPVLLIEEDSPFSIVAEYVQMIADVYEFDLSTIPFWVNKEQGFRITDDNGISLVQSAIASCPERPILTMFDACERIVPSDKFTSKELAPLITALQWLLSVHVTPVMIDHIRKPQQNKGTGTSNPTNLINELYGGQSKAAISDVMLHFAGNPRSGITMTYPKFRGETPPPVEIAFEPDTGFTLKDRPEKTKTRTEQKILGFINNNLGEWYGAEEILTAAGINEITGERALRALVKRKWLIKRGGTKGAEYRSNPNLPKAFE